MKTITATEALEKLEQVVADFGVDYVYKGVPRPDGKAMAATCVYVTTTTFDGEDHIAPSCGVGQVLSRLGVPLEPLLGTSENHATITSGRMAKYLSEQGVKLTTGAEILLSKFQNYQDDERPWGVALEAAKARLEMSLVAEEGTHV